MSWIYDRMQATGKPDVSDAGIAYFLLENDSDATPGKLRDLFGKWVAPRRGSPSASPAS